MAFGLDRYRDDEHVFEESGKVVLFLFLAYVFYWYLQGGYRVPFLGAIRFQLIHGALLSVIATVVLTQRKIHVGSVLGWTIALVFVMTVSTIFSIDVAHSWSIFVDRVLKFIMLGVFIVAFVTSPTALILFVATYLFAFFKMVQESVLGIFTGSMIWENQGTPRLHGVTPIYAHPNSLAGTQLGTIPFTYYLSLISKKKLRLLLLAQAFLASAIVIYSGSRTAYLGFLVMLVSFVLVSKRKAKSLLWLAIVLLLATPFIPAEYWERFDTIRTQQDEEGASIELRKQILTDSITIFMENPLGVGVGAFPKARQERFGRLQDTHNLYLEVATNLGVQGLIVFLGFIGAIFKSIRESQRKIDKMRRRMRDIIVPEPDVITRWLDLFSFILKAVSCFVLIRLTLGLFGHDMYEIYWWFAAGLTVAIGNMVRNLEEHLAKQPRTELEGEINE